MSQILYSVAAETDSGMARHQKIKGKALNKANNSLWMLISNEAKLNGK